MALACVAAVRFVSRKPVNWKMAFPVAMVGVASHLALDWTNVYGIRLLLPFSARWLRLDITSVVDPWIWTGLLLSVIAPALARLVGGEIGDLRRLAGRTAAGLCAGVSLCLRLRAPCRLRRTRSRHARFESIQRHPGPARRRFSRCGRSISMARIDRKRVILHRSSISTSAMSLTQRWEKFSLKLRKALR